MWKQVLPVIFVIASMVVLEGCWAVVGGAAAEAGYVAAQSDRTPGETIDDQRIVASVKTKLLADRDVSGLDINVDSFKGNVTLKGFVQSPLEAERALELAQSVAGVKHVTSKLVLE